MYKIAFFDVDGTILNRKAEIPDSTKRAMDTLHQKGVIPVIATGRPLYKIQDIMKALSIEHAVTFNGGLSSFKGIVYQEKSIDENHLKQLLGEAKEAGEGVTLFGRHGAFCSDIQHKGMAAIGKKLGYEMNGDNQLLREEIGDVFLATIYRKEKNRATYYPWCEKHYELMEWHDIVPENYHVDLHPLGQSKACGIKRALEHFSFRPEDAIAFGDGMNDKEMLAYVGCGIAMGNANPLLVKYANFTTAPVEQDGIEKGLKMVGLIS